jgi:phosphatidylinositol alpha-1,6-mannosyltransferase
VRLVLVTQDFVPRRGGIQTWALEISRFFARRCQDFCVIAPRAEGAEQADRALDFRVIRSGTPNTLIAAAAPALARLASRERFDHTLHAQWSTAPAALYLRQRGRLAHVTVAAHGRELLLEPWRKIGPLQSGYDLVRKHALVSADCILAGSAFTAGLVRDLGVRDERVRVVGYGVDPARFRPTDVSMLKTRLGVGQRPLLVTISRLVSRKGIDTVIRALSRVRARVPDVLYVIVGDGPDRTRLQALAEREGVAEAVRFAGPVPDAELPLWFSLGDMFVMPSRSDGPDVEGFGIVFLEASASGRPVVASRAGGIPDAVADGVSGLLVPPDDPARLAERILELLSDPARAADLGRRGRERVLAEFTWQAIGERTLLAMAGAPHEPSGFTSSASARSRKARAV